MSSPESGRDPSDIRGQQIEGFVLDLEKEKGFGGFPESITRDGKIFKRGFDDQKGNYFYTRPKENPLTLEMYLLDNKGTVIGYIDQTEEGIERVRKIKATEDQAEIDKKTKERIDTRKNNGRAAA